MSLLTRKKTLLAKIESSYGVDPTPTGSANAMLVKNLNANPIQAELVSRDLIRPYLGNSEQLLAEKYVTVDFEVEYAGSGAVGRVPAYDALLRACGMTKTTTTVSCTIAVTSNVATVTKATHGYIVGDIVTIAGCTDTDMNGEKTILTVPTANTFTCAAASVDDGAVAGSPVINSAIVYAPVSTAFESVTLYYNIDGILHKATGCFGSLELGIAVKQIPTFKFNFTGIYNAPTDTSAPTCDFSDFMIPKVVNTANTPGFTLFGYTGNMESMSMNLANEVSYVTLVGSETVKLLNRAPSGTLVFEAPTIASHDFFTDVVDSESGAMTISHGASNGYKVNFAAPAVMLGNPSYQDSNGVQMLSAPFTINPEDGDDEFTLTVK